jgi:hypothetical protein
MIETAQPQIPYWELSDGYHLFMYETITDYASRIDEFIFESAGDTSDAWEMFIH